LRASVTSTEAGFPKGDLGRRSSVWWALPRNQCDSLSRRCNTGLGVATDLWFWSVCSGNALYPCARALFWTEQVQKPCCAPVELGHRLINKRGLDVVEHGP